jgi:hypothetical protein
MASNELENLVRIGKLKAEPPNRNEIEPVAHWLS